VLEGPPGGAPYYRLLGRSGVDVIKRGGYKISALSVESALLEHPAVAEAAVVGLPDEVYGEVRWRSAGPGRRTRRAGYPRLQTEGAGC